MCQGQIKRSNDHITHAVPNSLYNYAVISHVSRHANRLVYCTLLTSNSQSTSSLSSEISDLGDRPTLGAPPPNYPPHYQLHEKHRYWKASIIQICSLRTISIHYHVTYFCHLFHHSAVLLQVRPSPTPIQFRGELRKPSNNVTWLKFLAV